MNSDTRCDGAHMSTIVSLFQLLSISVRITPDERPGIDWLCAVVSRGEKF